MSRAKATLENEGTEREHAQAIYEDEIVKVVFIATDKEPKGTILAEQKALADAEERV